MTEWEQERLLIFSAAELARRHRDRGLPLNQPEAVALMCDAMLEAARGGALYDEVLAAGRGAVSRAEVMEGVPELVEEVRLEVLMGDGTRLVVLDQPLGGEVEAAGANADLPPGRRALRPGEVLPGARDGLTAPARETRELTVRNTSRHVVRISSHLPFERANSRLDFERATAVGFRLDLPAGDSLRWGPGEERTVRLVRLAPAG